MDWIKKYGRQVAIGCMAAGMLCLAIAFFYSSANPSALVWVSGESQAQAVYGGSPIAGNWLLEAGIPLYPGDSIFFAGLETPPDFRVPDDDPRIIAYKPSFPITLTQNGTAVTFYSSAPTLGAALWEQGVAIKAGDYLSMPPGTPVSRALDIELIKGRTYNLSSGKADDQVYSAARTVGRVLKDAGVSLQDLDYSIPGEKEPPPAEGLIRVIRVAEEILTEEDLIPYTSERVADPEMAIGEEKVLQTGQNGVRVSSVRVRYENGEEVARETESEWISRQPISQKTAYGTQAVIQTSPEGLNYWLSKEVRVLSYKDTGSPTSSGIWPYYGVIAVSPEWYTILRGTSIYVPGYGVGTVLDVCPGCAGKDWIDVFIPTEDYVPWSRNETVYFLSPVPAGFSGDLP